MPTFPKTMVHEGFTLIELLIVIFIVSMVYFVGFSGVENIKAQPKALTPLNLKQNIITSKWFDGHATLLCVDACQACYLRKNIHSTFQPYTHKIDLRHITAYTLNAHDDLERIRYGRFKDKKICLKIDFYHNGSSTQLILKNDKKAYFLPAYFGKPQAFETPEDAKEYWLSKNRLVSDSGDYY